MRKLSMQSCLARSRLCPDDGALGSYALILVRSSLRDSAWKTDFTECGRESGRGLPATNGVSFANHDSLDG